MNAIVFGFLFVAALLAITSTGFRPSRWYVWLSTDIVTLATLAGFVAITTN